MYYETLENYFFLHACHQWEWRIRAKWQSHGEEIDPETLTIYIKGIILNGHRLSESA